jgi:glycosyltransferase involved in cell wall biosynthesis
MTDPRLRVLLVPDSVHWVTGTIAKSIARFNPWIEATIASGPVIDSLFTQHPDLMRRFDLIHFVCPYAAKDWLPRFRDFVPCVTSHHHVTDFELIKHNLEGDAIVVGSTEWVEDLRARGADMARVFCVPYGVDAETFGPPTEDQRAAVRARLKLPVEEVVIGFFGKNSSNDDDRKGTDVFTKAILELNGKIPGLAVLIVGPGWQRLVDCFNAAGVRCIWRPFVSDLEGLAKMYHALDFYWVTARVEGGPVTLLEAMSSEVCCLTTPVGIAREIVRDGENALLLPFNDPQIFVDRTIALANDENKRKLMCRIARRTILDQMHVAVTSQAVHKVYAKALENFSRRHRCAPQFDIANAVRSVAEVTSDKSDVVPLHGFPPGLHDSVRMLENLTWAEHLILYHRQWRVALGMVLREWIRHPFSTLPPRVLLRRLLPAPLVARIVKLKNGSRVQAKFIPTYSTIDKV